MRNALALAGVVLALTTSCARPNPKMQPDPGEGYVLETTGAAIGVDDVRRNEPDPTIGEVATRLAGQICEREARCHGGPPPEGCMRTFITLTALEVAKWKCSPAATRSRAEECTAALNAEPCEMSLATKPALCPVNDACPDPNQGLVSPGAVLAEEGVGQRAVVLPPFDRKAAAAALTAVDLSPCRDAEGPAGPAHITVTFAPDGAVLTSTLDERPDGTGVDLWGTARGQCIVERFREARVPVFEGAPAKMGVSIPAR